MIQVQQCGRIAERELDSLIVIMNHDAAMEARTADFQTAFSDPDLEFYTLIIKMEAEFLKHFRQMRVKCDTVLMDGNSGKSEDDSLPGAAEVCKVQAADGIQLNIFNIQPACLLIE